MSILRRPVTPVLSGVPLFTGTDTTSTADTGTWSGQYARSVSESTTVAESVTQTMLGVASSDAANGTDSVSSAATHSRTASETASGLDSISSIAIHPRGVSETVTPTDSASRTATHPRTASDTAPGTDSATRGAVFARSASDSAPGTDATGRATVYARSIGDTAHGTDSATRGAVHPRTTTDAAPGTDSNTRALVLPRSAPDTASGTDTVSRAFVGARTPTDFYPVTDDNSTPGHLGRQGTDIIAVTETLVPQTLKVRSASDSVPLSDAATRVTLPVRLTAENIIGTADAPSRANSVFARRITETVVGAVTRNRMPDFTQWTPYGAVIDDTGQVFLSLYGGVLSPLIPVSDVNQWWFSLEFFSNVDTTAQAIAYFYQADGKTATANANGHTSETKDYTFPTGTWSDRDAQGWTSMAGGSVAFVRFYIQRTGATVSTLLHKPLSGVLGGASNVQFNRITLRNPMVNTTAAQGFSPYLPMSSDQAAITPNWQRRASDSIPLSDAGTKILNRIKSATDTTTLSESPAWSFIPGRRGNDSIPLSDTATRVGKMTARVPAQSAPAGDGATRGLLSRRSASESIPTGEGPVGTRFVWWRLSTDTNAVTDTGVPKSLLGRDLSEATALTERATRMAATTHTASDAVQGSDASTSRAHAFQNPTDSLHGSDAAVPYQPNHRFPVDTAPALDSGTRVRDRRFRLDEIIRSSDHVSSGVQASRFPADSSPAHDVATQMRRVVRGLLDVAVPLDAAASSSLLLRRLLDAADVADQGQINRVYARASTEATALAEALLALRTRLGLASDSAPGVDTGEGVKPTLVVAVDTIYLGPDVALQTVTAFVPFGPPVVLSAELSAAKVSDVTGYDQSVLTFTFDQDVQAWTVRLGASGPFSGRALASWSGAPQRAGTATIEAGELLPGANDISVYGYARGRWTDSLATT